MGVMTGIFKKLNKKKIFTDTTLAESKLARHLTALDLTLLGIGSTLGVGIYVLAGSVAKNTAGPAVVISFLLAAIASVFAGLCYAEFGARVPRAGSAYVYSYVCVGEFVAFVIGWNLILEYAIGGASVARGLSAYFDVLFGNKINNFFNRTMHMDEEFLTMKLADYPDFFAAGITLLFICALSFGVKESSKVNNVFTILNVLVVMIVIIAGAIKGNPHNWSRSKNEVPANTENPGEGGFFPFGVKGMVAGAASCFYGFVGFDCVATAGEEAKNPQRTIPIAVIGSLTVIFIAYFGVSTVLTMMVPYYLQDPNSPIPKAFEDVGWDIIGKIVSIGAIFGLLTSLFGSLFPLPRIVYAMASDGIIFRFLGKVNSRFKTPVIGTILSGALTITMTLIFNMEQLVDMMSIGTLMAYSIVSACVLLLRYQKNEGVDNDIEENIPIDNSFSFFIKTMLQILNLRKLNSPTSLSGLIVSWEVLLFFILHPHISKYQQMRKYSQREKMNNFANFHRLAIMMVRTHWFLCSVIACLERYYYNSLEKICISLGLMAVIVHTETALVDGNALAITGVSLLAVLLIFILISISRQPVSKMELSFKVPFVPVVPALSILINVYLMMMLDNQTWKRFGLWMTVGLLIYVTCGILEEKKNQQNQRCIGTSHSDTEDETFWPNNSERLMSS